VRLGKLVVDLERPPDILFLSRSIIVFLKVRQPDVTERKIRISGDRLLKISARSNSLPMRLFQ
jgi:hypothetical protein